MIQQRRNKSTARYSIADTGYSLIALFPKGTQKSWFCLTQNRSFFNQPTLWRHHLQKQLPQVLVGIKCYLHPRNR